MDYDEKLRIKNKDASPGKVNDNGKWILKAWLSDNQYKQTLLLFVF